MPSAPPAEVPPFAQGVHPALALAPYELAGQAQAAAAVADADDWAAMVPLLGQAVQVAAWPSP